MKSVYGKENGNKINIGVNLQLRRKIHYRFYLIRELIEHIFILNSSLPINQNKILKIILIIYSLNYMVR